MKSYVMMIAGGAMLSAFADIMAPEEWKKYIKIITGFILLAVIVTPAARLGHMELFAQSFSDAEVEYTPMPQMVAEELEKRVEQDAEDRMKSEYSADCEIDASVKINSDGLIESVEKMTVKTNSARTEAIRKRLCEVYGLSSVEFLGENSK